MDHYAALLLAAIVQLPKLLKGNSVLFTDLAPGF